MEKRDFNKEFEKVFHQLSARYSSWDVWDDFLYMTAASFSNVMKTENWQEREEEYLSRISKYPKEMQDKFPELLSIVVLALDENPEQDFLGSMYHRLNLHQKQKGQFFTPYHISELMAEITIGSKESMDEEIRRKGFISVNDSCCGAGAMLIAFANMARKHGLNYQNSVLFMAQDIDRTAALMCYIQLSLLGCSAVVIVGDSLLKPGFHPDNEVWYTPLYYLNHWRFQGAEQEEAAIVVPSDVPAALADLMCEEQDGQIALKMEVA